MYLILVLWTSLALAKEGSCKEIQSYKEFYLCSLEKHPLYEISRLKQREGEALVEQAGQWQNPTISYKSVGGSNAGEKVGNSELSASVSLSQLWQRGAKKGVAEADRKIADIESNKLLLDAKKNLIRDLYRLRQIEDEYELTTEALGTFAKIESQFRSRRARGPEQEISLNLVELASGDYELRKNHLEVEKSEIVARLKALWGPQFAVKKEYLPPVRKSWPELKVETVKPSLEVQRIFADAERAQAEHRLAVRETWPEIFIGPTLESDTTGPSQVTSYGVNATITVPLLSLNGGARKLARVKADQSEVLYKFAANRSESEKEILIQKYKSSVDSLLKSTRRQDVRGKHVKVDGLFRQGLAPSSLVIEAHRQIGEFTASQHEHENSAIEAYLEVKTLNGEDIEGIL